MFTDRTPDEPTKLDQEIARLLTQLSGTDFGTPEYGQMVTNLSVLYKAKETDSNMKVKVIESLMKQEELATSLIQKEAEIANKLAEANANLDLKKSEVAIKQRELEIKIDSAVADAEIKAIEVDLKRQETEATCRLRDAETELKKLDVDTRKRVSPDTIAIIAANLGGIIAILAYEKVNVITSKALGFVSKLR